MKLLKNILIATVLTLIFSQTSFAEYTKTFRISAYYSPLPCQSWYVTGSYEGDIRLNGRGTNGADGTEVYPGMIAAPKTYAFGTKMYIPGIGTTAVHDRGGAIVDANNYSGEYDRLDVWMGYGDTGLARALNWGKRNIDVTVYGVDSSIVEDVYLPGFTPYEANNVQCSSVPTTIESVEFIDAPAPDTSSNYFNYAFDKGDHSNDVLKLQEELAIMNFYKAESTGVFDDLTEHALFKFQQSQGIVADEYTSGAGYLGPMTRQHLNKIISFREENLELIAEANGGFSSKFIAKELGFGDVSTDVTALQEFLIDQGVYAGSYTSNYYGEITKMSVLELQLKYGVIQSESDTGAGRVGPKTLQLINSLS